VVVGAYTIEVEQGADLNEPRGSAPPMVRAARVIVAGRPQQCLTHRAGLPPSVCMIPLALGLGEPEGASRTMLAAAIGEESQSGHGWGQPTATGGAGCDRYFVPTGEPDQDLQRLAAMCTEGPDREAATRPLRAERGEGEDGDRHRIHLEAGECYRVLGVGGAGVTELELGLVDPSGRLVARDLVPRSWSVLPASGPVCPDRAGDWEVVVAVERGRGRYAAQVWKFGR